MYITGEYHHLKLVWFEIGGIITLIIKKWKVFAKVCVEDNTEGI